MLRQTLQNARLQLRRRDRLNNSMGEDLQRLDNVLESSEDSDDHIHCTKHP